MHQIKIIPFQSTWEIRHAVMWPNKSIAYVKLPNDQDGLHFGLFISQQLVSIVSVFISSYDAQIRKFATIKEHQGKGYGTTLLGFIFSELENRNLKRVWCNARADKVNFYERFSLTKTNNTFSKGGIDYVIMEKSTSPKI